MTLILASSSSARLKLLAQIGIIPDLIIAPEIDETPLKNELPRECSIRLAIAKAQNTKEKILHDLSNAAKFKTLLQSNPNKPQLILACDTVSALGRRMLPKASSDEEVKKCLEKFSGRRHRVYSSVCLLRLDDNSKPKIRTSITQVKFKRLSDFEIKSYLASKEGIGKAGGCDIQGRAAQFVTFISGCYFGVVGLPLNLTRNLLDSYITHDQSINR